MTGERRNGEVGLALSLKLFFLVFLFPRVSVLEAFDPLLNGNRSSSEDDKGNKLGK
jgi:hypothetical protein